MEEEGSLDRPQNQTVEVHLFSGEYNMDVNRL